VTLPFVIPKACDFTDLSREVRDFNKIVILRAYGFTDLSYEILDFKQNRHPESLWLYKSVVKSSTLAKSSS
jgi:hypothetical protein